MTAFLNGFPVQPRTNVFGHLNILVPPAETEILPARLRNGNKLENGPLG